MPESRQTISVAMCTFNGAEFIAEQLASIAAQTRRPDELIVSDDGSVDATRDVVSSFARGAGFPVRLVANESRLGPAANFERAISLCSGDVIALSDQDDVWDAKKLSIQEEAIEAQELDAVFSDAEVVGCDLLPLGETLWDTVGFSRRERDRLRRDQGLEVLLRRDVVMGASLLFRARYRDPILPIPTGWMHDAWIGLVVAAIGRLGLVERPLVKYRQHGGNHVGAPTSRHHRASFAEQASRYRSGAERLRQLAGHVDPELAARLEAKAAHLEDRATLPNTDLRRAGVVARELLSGRYHRYGRGWLSAGKDLVARR